MLRNHELRSAVRVEPGVVLPIDSPQPPLLTYLQAMLPSLNATERRIGEYILEHPERVLSSSIEDIQQRCGTSEGSVVRFCRMLGVKGFGKFKISLARELPRGLLSDSVKAVREQVARSLYEGVFQLHLQSIRETLRLNSGEILELNWAGESNSFPSACLTRLPTRLATSSG